jgi:hypothetical protein
LQEKRDETRNSDLPADAERFGANESLLRAVIHYCIERAKMFTIQEIVVSTFFKNGKPKQKAGITIEAEERASLSDHLLHSNKKLASQCRAFWLSRSF